MRIVFMGTPDFAIPTLAALNQQGHEIVAVYCQPARKKGRGHQVQPCPVHLYAQSHGWPVHTPLSLKTAKEQAAFNAHKADLCVVVAYGLLLPQEILSAPKRGCINVHASLLPRWRGAAPIQRAIEAGDQQTGISIMQMDLGLDTGDVIAEEAIAIAQDETAATLHDKLAQLGADLCARVSVQKDWSASKQDEALACYAPKLNKAEGLLDFSLSAEQIERKIRAFTPFPSCYFIWQDQMIKVLKASIQPLLQAETQEPCGTVLDDQLSILCANKTVLRLEILQRAGKKAMPAQDFLRGLAIPKGQSLQR